ncbi:MAG TPA: gamma-glutamyltransferase [Solirubrobacteraceae bacterium]|nr:gamma-glutamyltransferase [Solirubrobacteraceae bacterium]
MGGVVAAGHPVTAEAGADVLRAGGNAVDAAIGAMLASFAAEPLLTGLGAGGFMLVVPPDREPVLLDFFVEAPGREGDPAARAPLVPVDVSFGDVVQVFHIGASAAGTYGTPSGICTASQRFGTVPLEALAAPAAALARAGVEITPEQAYVYEILAPIEAATPESRALFMPEGRLLQAGDRFCNPDLGDALERLAADGDAPFYTGDVAEKVTTWVAARGGMLGPADLAAYTTCDREPIRVDYHGRDVLLNPPPSAGGILIAYALAVLARTPGAPSTEELVEVMGLAQAERTPAFLAGLADPGFQQSFLARRLGSTTHISVLDEDGWGCSVTCTNGEGCGEVVPGTGIHLNNMMGEQDLSPLGWFRHPPGRRLPSMMAPTIVLADGRPELVVGSAGSNRIRSAILQVIVNVLDRGMDAVAAVEAPRIHFEDGVVYAEPGVDLGPLIAQRQAVERFRTRNLFFGGAQAVLREPGTGLLSGAADPRRGGSAVIVREQA